MLDVRAGCAGLAAIALCGCAMAPDIHRRVQDEVGAAVRMEAGRAAEPVDADGSGAPPGLENILVDVIRADHSYRMAMAEKKATGVEREAAGRQPWPRLVAEGLVEVPIKNGEATTQVTGGLYLRLDLMRAFLQRNAVTAADVGLAANRELCRGAALEASRAFLHRVENLEAALGAVQQNEAALRLAERASAEADEMFRAGRASFERGSTWERRRLEKEIEKQRADVRLEKARREVARAYRGPALEADLVRQVADFVERLEAEPEKPEVDLAEILERDPSVTKAKLNLFLAEMAILDARLKRLPEVSFDLGAGDIPIQGDSEEEEADLVPMLRVSMPLIDFGDVSRGVQRARIRAEQSREQMKQAVETAHENWQAVRQELSLAEVSLRAARSFCDAIRRRGDETRAFYGSGSASALDVHEVEWMQIEAEALSDQAAHELRLARLAERAVRGELFNAEWQGELDAKTDLDPP